MVTVDRGTAPRRGMFTVDDVLWMCLAYSVLVASMHFQARSTHCWRAICALRRWACCGTIKAMSAAYFMVFPAISTLTGASGGRSSARIPMSYLYVIQACHVQGGPSELSRTQLAQRVCAGAHVMVYGARSSRRDLKAYQYVPSRCVYVRETRYDTIHVTRERSINAISKLYSPSSFDGRAEL